MIDNLPPIRGSYRENFKLANVTWFNVGGCADILFKPADLEDLQFFLKNRPKDLPITILGVGSNLLVRDGGIRGVVIRLGKEFNHIEYKDELLATGAGILDINVSKFCAENSLAGLEFLSGIPGVIGAAVAMNAGAYGSEIKDFLVKVEAVDYEGNFITLSNKDCGFYYRGNSLNNKYIFTKAYFKVEHGDKEKIINNISHIQQQRELSQPIRSRTGGSTFKNPNGYKAWELIDQSGCRGMKLKDAMISEKHCNFLINLGNASAKDLEDLGNLVREKIYQKTGIQLEWEIKIIGEK